MFVCGPACCFRCRAFSMFRCSGVLPLRRVSNHDRIRSNMSASSAVTAVLAFVVHVLVGLTLALLLGRAACAIAAAVDAALAIVPLVGAAAVPQRLAALMPLLRGGRVRALVDGGMAFLLFAAVVVVACGHRSLSGRCRAGIGCCPTQTRSPLQWFRLTLGEIAGKRFQSISRPKDRLRAS